MWVVPCKKFIEDNVAVQLKPILICNPYMLTWIISMIGPTFFTAYAPLHVGDHQLHISIITAGTTLIRH